MLIEALGDSWLIWTSSQFISHMISSETLPLDVTFIVESKGIIFLGIHLFLIVGHNNKLQKYTIMFEWNK